MPIYEYRCDRCDNEFEMLVFSSTEVKCPDCGSKDVTKKFSVFGMSGVEKPFAGSASSGCSTCSTTSACKTCK